MEPTLNNNRIHLIDSIRGFALIGLPFVNVIALWASKMNLSETQGDIWVQRFLYIFVEGRFYAIFSFLFGLGLWIFLSRAKDKNNRPYMLFIRRIIILAIVGFIHQFIHPGEALLVYAILGILVLPFEKLPKQMNLILGILGIIMGSIIGPKLLLTFPLMLLGIAFGQYRIFEKANSRKKVWMLIFVISFIATMILTLYLWENAPKDGLVSYLEGMKITDIQAESNQAFYQFIDLSVSLAPIFSVFYVSFLVVIGPLLNKLLSPLNSFGRMAFTNYIGQTVLLLIIARLISPATVVSYTFATITCALVVII